MGDKAGTSESALRSAVAQYTSYRDEYLSLQTTLKDLPSETTYPALIPIGPLAFFPGHLIHTNEILVLLGENYFAERSALQASQIAQRRAQYADKKIAEIQAQMARGRVERLSEDGVVEIKEEVQVGERVFGDDEGDAVSEVAEGVGGVELEEKRLRAVRGEQVAVGVLGEEEQRVLEMMERLVAEGDGDEEEEEEGEEEDSDVDEEGDAFEHEDRANAARDDDEDDFNDDVSDEDPSDPPVREHPAESSIEPPATPKGILKKSTPILSPNRRTPSGTQNKNPAERTVSFSPAPAKSSPQNPPAAITPRAAQQPMKHAVVERPVDEDYAPTLDEVDQAVHAREIAQAYSRMRFAKKDAWGLDRMDVAERVLENTPGVTLVGRVASAVSEEHPQEGVRIELPPDPSPYNMLNMPRAPPRVVHQDPLPKPAPNEPEAPAKPKMSRFKAKRLGLE
ncbi:uri1, prefoldin-like chaperone [Coemansia interrupta]|uniref:Uri1, prefoldin-like chaperone n=1 Tax=Coemansia interrupta TaxID=1126814 RepID=A0A9W8HFK0_9FUNG|nr:uri1, prefoldin-like chaperone [Coemansia interrupta]